MSEQQQQRLMGYFAVVLLGLLCADALSDWMMVLLEPYVPSLAAHQGILIAAMFFAICFANPFIWIIGQARLRETLVWAVAGCAFGVAFHLLVIEPITGPALARFSMLFVAGLGVPISALMSWASTMIPAREKPEEVEVIVLDEDYSDLDYLDDKADLSTLKTNPPAERPQSRII